MMMMMMPTSRVVVYLCDFLGVVLLVCVGLKGVRTYSLFLSLCMWLDLFFPLQIQATYPCYFVSRHCQIWVSRFGCEGTLAALNHTAYFYSAPKALPGQLQGPTCRDLHVPGARIKLNCPLIYKNKEGVNTHGSHKRFV